MVVTSHRHPIARLTPLAEDAPAIAIMTARRPVASLKKIKGVKLSADPVAFLLADRRRR